MMLIIEIINNERNTCFMAMSHMSRQEFEERQKIIQQREQEHHRISFQNGNSSDDIFAGIDPPRSHRLIKMFFILLTLIVTWLGLLEYRQIHQVSRQVFAVKTHQVSPELKNKKPISVLAMGVDVGALNRGNSGGNTDSMELFTINPKTQTMTMTSIPRDTLVRVDTKKGPDYVKLNAAYSIAGPKQTTKQVSELLDVPIKYYAVINMGTLQTVVNNVGGVDVNNPFAFDYEGHHFPQGNQHLNGALALKYSRMRYSDPNNDYGRQKRQQQILESIISNFKKRGSISVANKLLAAVGDGVRTNVPINEVQLLYVNYKAAMNHVQTQHLQGQNATIEGASFQIASTAEINRVSKLIRQQLGLKPVKVNNHETRLYDSQPDYKGNNDSPFILPGGAHYNDPGSGNGSDVVVSHAQKAQAALHATELSDSDVFGKWK